VFEDAAPGRTPAFPRDHGKHPDFQTEWWYFSGNLQSAGNRRWGFQLTFFRRSLVKTPTRKNSSWAVRDLYPAHFALSDVKNRAFFHCELIAREGPGLAEAATDRLRVRLKDWIAEQQGEEIRLKARQGGYSIDLTLLPLKPPALHGRSGYSRKGDNARQASYYYSFTRLKARGSVTFKGSTRPVTGQAWMDHEFGSGILTKDQAGWDWFSVQLDDGTELMAFHLRRKDGTFEQPFGTFVKKDGRTVNLSGRDVKISPAGTWTSPHTGATYPCRWTIDVPGERIKLEIVPLLEDQELSSGKSTGVIYWEGAVKALGTREDRKVQGRGYVELTGYAHPMAGRL